MNSKRAVAQLLKHLKNTGVTHLPRVGGTETLTSFDPIEARIRLLPNQSQSVPVPLWSWRAPRIRLQQPKAAPRSAKR